MTQSSPKVVFFGGKKAPCGHDRGRPGLVFVVCFDLFAKGRFFGGKKGPCGHEIGHPELVMTFRDLILRDFTRFYLI